jgi:hypothetical protein
MEFWMATKEVVFKIVDQQAELPISVLLCIPPLTAPKTV